MDTPLKIAFVFLSLAMIGTIINDSISEPLLWLKATSLICILLGSVTATFSLMNLPTSVTSRHS